MKIPLSWLKEYLPLTLSPEEIAEQLTLAGLEVDKIDKNSLPFTGVVVAKILTVSPHPNAEKLCITKVFDGKEELQIVCGAPNCKPGMKVALAQIGATLTDEEGKVLKIKKGKLRDVESFGMLCSGDELGFPTSYDGILDLPQDLVEGTDLASLYADIIFDISLTPNLGHCMSVLGVARELSALLGIPLKKHKSELKEESDVKTENLISLRVEDSDACPVFSARVVQNITVGPSPDWMQRKLKASGVRSINVIVDIGNYIMLEYGQPLHMFDYDKISGKQLIISSQTPYSNLVTLDDKLREIPKGSLIICDKEKALSFAGIMGGKESAVTDATQNVLIEAAYFKPESIRKTSKLLQLRTDGSQRFDREIDPEVYKDALDRAAELLQKYAGGQVTKSAVVFKAKPYAPRELSLRVSRVNQLLGTKLSLNEVITLLKRAEIGVKENPNETLLVQIPSYRNDLKIEADLIEEIARLYGYNRLLISLPRHITSPLPHAPIYLFENQTRQNLMSEGLQECLTCDLISPKLAELTHENSDKQSLISVLHPTSVEQSVLRLSLLPGLLQVIKYNQDHQNHDISGFEVGRIHFKARDQFIEQSAAGIILAGNVAPPNWETKSRECDFFDLKGIVENYLKQIGVSGAVFEISHLRNFHPYRQAHIKVGDTYVGALGEVHPSHVSEMGIAKRVFFAELNLHDLYPLKRKNWSYQEVTPYPGSERDWTLSLKVELPIGSVLETIQSKASPLLENVQLIDLYQSEQIGKDRKNATFRFFYRDPEKTISIETVEREHAKLMQEVAEKLRDHIM